MIGSEDAPYTYEYDNHFKILSAIHDGAAGSSGGRKVAPDFIYSSDRNQAWMSVEELQAWIAQNRSMIGQI